MSSCWLALERGVQRVRWHGHVAFRCRICRQHAEWEEAVGRAMMMMVSRSVGWHWRWRFPFVKCAGFPCERSFVLLSIRIRLCKSRDTLNIMQIVSATHRALSSPLHHFFFCPIRTPAIVLGDGSASDVDTTRTLFAMTSIHSTQRPSALNVCRSTPPHSHLLHRVMVNAKEHLGGCKFYRM